MRQRSIGYVLAIALSTAAMAAAQEQPAQSVAQERQIEGEVVEVSATMLTVRTSDGRTMSFSVDHDLTAGASPITVGSRVRVEYRGEQDLEAVNVSRLPIGQDLDDEGTDNGAEVEARPQAGQPASPAPREELPGTASPIPAMLVTGLALLGSGLGLSARRRA